MTVDRLNPVGAQASPPSGPPLRRGHFPGQTARKLAQQVGVKGLQALSEQKKIEEGIRALSLGEERFFCKSPYQGHVAVNKQAFVDEMLKRPYLGNLFKEIRSFLGDFAFKYLRCELEGVGDFFLLNQTEHTFYLDERGVFRLDHSALTDSEGQLLNFKGTGGLLLFPHEKQEHCFYLVACFEERPNTPEYFQLDLKRGKTVMCLSDPPEDSRKARGLD